MSNIQYYSNNNFNRAGELREINTETSDILMLPVFEENFFLTKEEQKSVFIDTPKELSSLSNKKYFLGLIDNKEIWCVDLSKVDYAIVSNFLPDFILYSVRDCFHLINERDASLLAYAKGIVSWNNTHQYCNNCGSKTKSEEKGHGRKCLNTVCEVYHFPRINPAIIVLIEYKQKGSPPLCLLNMHKNEYNYGCSLFSGFVEIGESLEDTVKREMKEEVNLIVNNINYATSQPWSFSSSLMLGFTAETKNKDFEIDNKEIKEAKWFSAKEINQMIEEKKLVISHKDSISNYLIEQWTKQNS